MAVGFASADAARGGDKIRVVIDVDLTRHVVCVDKYEGRRRPVRIFDEALPIVEGTVKPGVYRPRRGRAAGLENVVFFAGSRSLRTSLHYPEMKAAGTAVAGSVVLSPDFGGLLFSTLSRPGTLAMVRVHR